MSVWSKAIDDNVPHAMTESYADGTQALARTRQSVTRIAAETQEFADLSGQTLDAAKSFAFATVEGHRKR
eukprot:10044574-Karenia_brevis.AAC.1